MATYQKKLRRSKDGCYVRYIGKNAKGQSEKFRLGFDAQEAEKREVLILDLWEHQERHTDPFLPFGFHWTPAYLKAAKAIAKGKPPTLPPTYIGKTTPSKYVDAVNEMGDELLGGRNRATEILHLCEYNRTPISVVLGAKLVDPNCWRQQSH